MTSPNELIHREEYAYDERGRKTEAACFGVKGETVAARRGIARITTAYDERGKKEETRWRLGPGGYAFWKRTDEAGRLLELASLDQQARPKPDAEVGGCFFDAERQPVLHRKLGYHGMRIRLDGEGRSIATGFVGVKGEPINAAVGFCRMETDHAKKERSFFRAVPGGEPRLWRRLDAKNRLLTDTVWEKDKPRLHKDGHHRTDRRYDEAGRVVEMACFGLDGKPVLNAGLGSHRWVDRYDEKGQQVEGSNFGTAGEKVRHLMGHHRWEATFNEAGKQLSFALYDIDGKPVVTKHGYARREWVYDAMGKHTGFRDLDEKGQPVKPR